MKILLLGLNYAPELIGTGPYTAGLVEALAERGHDDVVALCKAARGFYDEVEPLLAPQSAGIERDMGCRDPKLLPKKRWPGERRHLGEIAPIPVFGHAFAQNPFLG